METDRTQLFTRLVHSDHGNGDCVAFVDHDTLQGRLALLALGHLLRSQSDPLHDGYDNIYPAVHALPRDMVGHDP